MRYQLKPQEFDAYRWDGQATTYEEMQAGGVPVLWDATQLYVAVAGGAKRHVRVGEWVTLGASGWSVTSEATLHEHAQPAVEPERPPEASPFPELQRFSMVRVGFRRQWLDKEQGAQWEHRFDGLSRAEMDEGGWHPLFTLEVTQ